MAAPTLAQPPPAGERLMAPRQASVAAVALVEAEGHMHTSPQCPYLHPHQYPPAHAAAAHWHRSGALAHLDPDPRLLFSCFTAARNIKAHQEYKSRPFFKFDQKLSTLRILNHMLHAYTIDFCTVIVPVGQIRATTDGFSDMLH